MASSPSRGKSGITQRDMAYDIHDLLNMPVDSRGPLVGLQIISTIIKTITDSLRAGDDVHIRGFGIFRVEERKARTIRNCFVTNTHRTSEPITYPAHKTVVFIPSAVLLAMLNVQQGDYTSHERESIEYHNHERRVYRRTRRYGERPDGLDSD